MRSTPRPNDRRPSRSDLGGGFSVREADGKPLNGFAKSDERMLTARECAIRLSVAPQAFVEDPLRHSRKHKELALRFVENMKKFSDQTPEEVIAAGPKAYPPAAVRSTPCPNDKPPKSDVTWAVVFLWVKRIVNPLNGLASGQTDGNGHFGARVEVRFSPLVCFKVR